MAGTVTLTGFKEFEKKLQNLSSDLKEEFDAETQDAVNLWRTGAINDAPVDQGFLRGQMSIKQNAQMEWEVVSGADYSAYIEWGTKSRVKVPAELQGYASQFRGKGPPGGAQAIYDWCRRVGIPQNVWVFVYLSIMRKGIHPHPFFFIQMPLVQEALNKNILNILNTEH